MRIGNRVFEDSGKTYIMAILNVTPDSLSDGGRYNNVDKALVRCEHMIEEGADIIDIGGESTRPGYIPVGDNEELRRIIPVIQSIKREFDIPISVDTYHSRVAREAAYAGADLINDIWGLKFEGNAEPMAEVVKQTDTAVCIMHNSDNKIILSDSLGEYDSNMLVHGIDTVVDELNASINLALAAGIEKDKIMIDPGVGFAKDYYMNMAATANLDTFVNMGFPLLLGTSSKSLIGMTLDLPVSERLEGTIATSVMAVMYGCSFVRVHNVKSNKRAITMTEELLKYRV